MKLNDWLRKATPDEREACAKHAGTSVNRLYQIAGGHSPASVRSCHDIAAGTAYEVTPHEIRADYFPHPQDGLPAERRTQVAA